MRTPTTEEAERFIEDSGFVWHQKWELAPGVVTPGVSDIAHSLAVVHFPDVRGKSVLDIGTCNGGTLFELERRGASRLVGVDIYDDQWFGFGPIRDLLGSSAVHRQASVYDLDRTVEGEHFDIVLFLGLLYHLRHPLLALDIVRSLTREFALLETSVSDGLNPELSSQPWTYFYRRDELNRDGSNWFSPTSRTLVDWCLSCGFDTKELWVDGVGSRAVVGMVPKPGDPEFVSLSYERPLQVVADLKFMTNVRTSGGR